jgi:hypothetical protein
MVMATGGTFDYSFVIPEGPRGGTREMQGALRQPLQGDPERLLGHAPLLETVEYHREKWQLLCRITLAATEKKHSMASSFSFTVDRELIAMLRKNDALHISRTYCAGLGLSVLRGGELVAAAGAVTHVPLGPTVSVRHPRGLIEAAEAIFRARDREYEMCNYPVELRVGDVLRILQAGRPTVGDYEILVRHGPISDIPGTDECVSIERLGICPSTAAHNSAQLMEEYRHEIG